MHALVKSGVCHSSSVSTEITIKSQFFEADRFAERAEPRNSLNLTGRSDLSGSLTWQIEANRFAEHAKPRNALNLTGRSNLSGSQIEADRFAERALSPK